MDHGGQNPLAHDSGYDGSGQTLPARLLVIGEAAHTPDADGLGEAANGAETDIGRVLRQLIPQLDVLKAPLHLYFPYSASGWRTRRQSTIETGWPS